MKEFFKKIKSNGFYVILSCIIISIMASLFLWYNAKEKDEAIEKNEAIQTINFQTTLENKLLRFHIKANSDSEEDQRLKVAIKNKIINYLTPVLKTCKDVEESKKLATAHFNDLEKIASDEMKIWGRNYGVKVYITKKEFPYRKYGDLIFPQGTYQSLQVVLGNGDGKNWWCVMFPPLCLTDMVSGTVPDSSKKKLEEVVGAKYYLVLDQGNAKENKPKVIGRLKCIEIFNSILNVFQKK